jgi:2,4-dienoyl-CoA reductase-like NADH-dependent reductase (Old Yellow Enzyme family)
MLLKLFENIDVGGMKLPNRILIAPCTRSRATLDEIPTDIMVTDYRQRVRAGPIITGYNLICLIAYGLSKSRSTTNEAKRTHKNRLFDP